MNKGDTSRPGVWDIYLVGTYLPRYLPTGQGKNKQERQDRKDVGKGGKVAGVTGNRKKSHNREVK